ncbi:uncharacterized protein LOC115452773 [Manduca sexta]|uniref:uncharacterized protein LOC115452773 n=1 Tax=Manduca sexta TaxID=7130 RepID=UPI001890759F|nr:uncharacterized protein LOC115452773 [Manduca sexta]
MGKIIVLLGLALMACGVLGEPAIVVKFGRGPAIGTSYYFTMPLTLSSAIDDYGWIEYESPVSVLPNIRLYCAPEGVWVCIFYEDNGLPAGLQIAAEKSKFNGKVLDWDIQGYTSWSVEVQGVVREYWTTQQYYMSKELLELSCEDRLAAYDTTDLLKGALWVSGFNRELREIPKTGKGMLADGFYLHNCIPGMGYHYYYNMTEELVCGSDTLVPWAPMTRDDKVIGVVLNMIGKIKLDAGEKNYYEDPTVAAIRSIVSTGPQCLYDAATTPGLTTMHVFYVTKPNLITCPKKV